MTAYYNILVWNPVTKRRHELSSMGIRVTKEALVQQLEAHLGEVSVTVWPKVLKEMGRRKNIFVLE